MACCLIAAAGCHLSAPIHVWQPAKVPLREGCRVALTPVAGQPELAQRIERELLAQRPAARGDVALYTSEQLARSSPIRLASTASLTSDITALHAARSLGADVLLQGEILSARLATPAAEEEQPPENVNFNKLFFERMKKEHEKPKDESLLLSWRVIDVPTGRTLGTRTFSIDSRDAVRRYPDLQVAHAAGTSILVPASARETWKAIAPIVSKERVNLAVPWLQPGAFTVRRGVWAARKGNWQKAEQYWSQVADRYSFCAAAQHNLALAYAAREDFPAAKQRLMQADGLLAAPLPADTLYWLDRHHRDFNGSHRLGKPIDGWAFPDPSESTITSAEPIDIDDLPWWTAIPFTKPPGWSWHGWLTQPWVF